MLFANRPSRRSYLSEIKLVGEYPGGNANGMSRRSAAAATAAGDNHATAALCERPLNLSMHSSAGEAIARNKAPRFVADAVANGCAVTGPHSTEPRMRDATHSIVFYILPGRFSPRRYS